MITKNKKLFTYIFSAIIAVAVCAGMQFFNVSAADNQDDIQTDANGLVYNLSYNTKSAEIIGYTGTSTEITVNQFVTFDYTETVIGSDGVPITNTFPVKYTVKSLGSDAFSNNTNITRVVFNYEKTVIASGAFRGCSGLTTVQLPTKLAEIDAETFADCINLSAIKIPDSVKTIGSKAFENCTSLSSIETSKNCKIGVEAFKGCSGLTTVKAFGGVGEKAFADCDNLTAITVEGKIDFGAFRNCDSLTTATINDAVIGEYAFENCPQLYKLDIQAGVTDIGKGAFKDCTSIGKPLKVSAEFSTLELPKTIKTIGENAFEGCTSLIEIETYGDIDSNAFLNCTNLDNIVVKNGSINGNAFEGCTSLVKAVVEKGNLNESAFKDCTSLIEADVTGTVGKTAFEGCTGLKTVTVSGDIGEQAFLGCNALETANLKNGKVGFKAFENCDGLIKVDMYKTTAIAEYAFADCDNLGLSSSADVSPVSNKNRLTIPATVKTIGAHAFSSCDNLDHVSIEVGVQEIGDYAFEDCTNLIVLNMHSTSTKSSLRKIGDYAFNNCISLGALDSPAKYAELLFPKTLEHIGKHAFSGVAIKKLTVPEAVRYIGYNAFENCKDLTFAEFKCNPSEDGEENFTFLDDIFLNIPYDKLTIKIPCNTLDFFAGCFPTYPKEKFEEHLWTEWDIAQAPTANNEGIEFRRCRICNKQEERKLPKTSKIGYYFDDATMTATVIDCSKDKEVTTVNVPAQTEFLGKKYTVVAIGETAFMDCTNLVNVTLPETITLIDKQAFAGCTNITTMHIPEAVAILKEDAFSGCSALRTVYFDGESQLKTMEKRTFKDCSKLTYILNGKSTPARPENNAVPPMVTEIAEKAFENTAISSIIIPETCERVLSQAFNGCRNLRNVIFKPRTAPDIGSTAFSGIHPNAKYSVPCEKGTAYKSKLGANLVPPQTIFAPEHKWTEWVLKPSATTEEDGEKTRHCLNCGEVQTEIVPTIIILRYSYDEKTKTAIVISCTKDETVQSVKIPQKTVYDGVLYNIMGIGAGAFKDCTNLKTITIPPGVTQIGSEAFMGCSNIKSIVVPDSVTAIGTGAFAECTTLSSAKIPDRLTEIPDRAFSGCVALKSFKMPGNVEKIGEKAFFETGLTTLTIPSPSTTIGKEAFASCSNLKTVTIAGRNVESEDPSAFRNVSDAATFKIPCGTSDKYSKLLSGKTIKENAHKWGKWIEGENGAKDRACTVCGEKESDSKNVSGLEYNFIVRVSSDWNDVLATAKKIKAGTLNVDLRAKLSVPSSLLSAMKGKDIYMNLELNNGIMWQLHGKKITAVTTPLNLNAKAVKGAIPKKLIQKTAGTRPHYEIQIPSRADFGLTATFIPKLDISYYGRYANLFYYNKKLNRMEFVRYSPVEDNGYAYFDLVHASEYLLVISDEPMGVNVELGAGVAE